MRSYSSRTKIGSRERAVMKDVLEKIMSHKLAYQFIHPVDWQALGLYDYPSIIPEPIDLTTIKTKL